LATIETVMAAGMLKDEALPPAVRALVRACVHEDGTLVLSDLSVRLFVAPFTSGNQLKPPPPPPPSSATRRARRRAAWWWAAPWRAA